MTIKLYDKVVKDMLAKDKKVFLHSAGMIGQNEWRSQSPYLTGAYKNSVHYKIENRESEFGTEGTGKGIGHLGTPKEDTVRIGLNLVYANYIERLQGVGARAMDYAIRAINSKLKRFF